MHVPVVSVCFIYVYVRLSVYVRICMLSCFIAVACQPVCSLGCTCTDVHFILLTGVNCQVLARWGGQVYHVWTVYYTVGVICGQGILHCEHDWTPVVQWGMCVGGRSADSVKVYVRTYLLQSKCYYTLHHKAHQPARCWCEPVSSTPGCMWLCLCAQCV